MIVDCEGYCYSFGSSEYGQLGNNTDGKYFATSTKLLHDQVKTPFRIPMYIEKPGREQGGRDGRQDYTCFVRDQPHRGSRQQQAGVHLGVRRLRTPRTRRAEGRVASPLGGAIRQEGKGSGEGLGGKHPHDGAVGIRLHFLLGSSRKRWYPRVHHVPKTFLRSTGLERQTCGLR